jgi:hypothetical protein
MAARGAPRRAGSLHAWLRTLVLAVSIWEIASSGDQPLRICTSCFLAPGGLGRSTRHAPSCPPRRAHREIQLDPGGELWHPKVLERLERACRLGRQLTPPGTRPLAAFDAVSGA